MCFADAHIFLQVPTYFCTCSHISAYDHIFLQVLTYLKMRSDSALRVTMHMTGRASYNQANKCHRWYVLFDDQECSSPASIEMVETSESATQYLQTMDSEY